MLRGRPRIAAPRMVTAAGREFQTMLRKVGRATVRILLVEDNPANLRVTQALLETLGCEVRAAVNGTQAVAAYRVNNITRINDVK